MRGAKLPRPACSEMELFYLRRPNADALKALAKAGPVSRGGSQASKRGCGGRSCEANMPRLLPSAARAPSGVTQHKRSRRSHAHMPVHPLLFLTGPPPTCPGVFQNAPSCLPLLTQITCIAPHQAGARDAIQQSC